MRWQDDGFVWIEMRNSTNFSYNHQAIQSNESWATRTPYPQKSLIFIAWKFILCKFRIKYLSTQQFIFISTRICSNESTFFSVSAIVGFEWEKWMKKFVNFLLIYSNSSVGSSHVPLTPSKCKFLAVSPSFTCKIAKLICFHNWVLNYLLKM